MPIGAAFGAAPERFDHGAIEAITDRAHRGDEARSSASASDGSRGELRTVVGTDKRTPGGLRLSIAMPSALVTGEAVGEASIDHPTIRREKVSSTTP